MIARQIPYLWYLTIVLSGAKGLSFAPDAADTMSCSGEHVELAAAGVQSTVGVDEPLMVAHADHKLRCVALCHRNKECKGISYKATEQQCTLLASSSASAYDANGGQMCRKAEAGADAWRTACETHADTPNSRPVYYKGACIVSHGDGLVDTAQKALDKCVAIGNATALRSRLVHVRSTSMERAMRQLPVAPLPEIGGHTRARRADVTVPAPHNNGPWVLIGDDGEPAGAAVLPPGAWVHEAGWKEPNAVGEHYIVWMSPGPTNWPGLHTGWTPMGGVWGHALCEIDNPLYTPKWVIKAIGERTVAEHVLQEVSGVPSYTECGLRCLQLPDCTSVAHDVLGAVCALQRFEYDEPYNDWIQPSTSVGKVAARGFVWYENE